MRGTARQGASEVWRPTPDQLRAARARRVRDVARPGLHVLMVGINPGLYSGAVGHHFARPGNRFWRTLHGAGFTERVLSPFEERLLLDRGVGITNLVTRTTARAGELSADELRAGAARLRRMVCRLAPRSVAVLGVSAYRVAFDQPRAVVGPLPIPMCGAAVWVLPNPSGLNAHYQLPALIEAFRELRASLG